jgi:hypothetical protein
VAQKNIHVQININLYGYIWVMDEVAKTHRFTTHSIIIFHTSPLYKNMDEIDKNVCIQELN